MSDWLKKYPRDGIKTATTPKERYVGLNDNRYDQMFFPGKGFNTFRGLDNRQPVSLIDENGKRVILYEPLQTVKMFGNVHEQRMEQGGVKKGWLDKYSAV